MMTESLSDDIAKLPECPKYPPFYYRPDELSVYYAEKLAAALARLELRGKWIVTPRHFHDCENKAFSALLCPECKGKLLAATEVPK